MFCFLLGLNNFVTDCNNLFDSWYHKQKVVVRSHMPLYTTALYGLSTRDVN